MEFQESKIMADIMPQNYQPVSRNLLRPGVPWPGPLEADRFEPHLRRVALLIQGDDSYGVGRVGREIATLLPGIRCVAFNRGIECDVLEDLGVAVHVLPSGAYFRGFSPQRGFLGALRQMARARPWWRRCAAELHAWAGSHGVCVLHGNVYSHYFTLGALRRAHPGTYATIWHTHNFLNIQRHLKLSARFVWRQARRGADRIVCVSHAMVACWAGSGVPVRVIHNSVPSRLRELPPAEVRGTGDPAAPLRLVGCGRMEWSKGLHVAVEAVARLRDMGIAALLDLYGGPLDGNPYHAAMRERIRELKLGTSVRFLGYVHDLPARLAAYDVALQCRIDPEPCSVYVLECMQAGVPLVASANGGTPELVRDDQDGWLYPSGDVRALANRIAVLARDPVARGRFARSARRRAHTTFAPEAFAERWSAIYAEAAVRVGRETEVPR